METSETRVRDDHGRFARAIDPELAAHIAEHTRFLLSDEFRRYAETDGLKRLPKGKWCYYISKNGTKYAVHNVGGKLRAFKVPSQQEVALIPDMKAKISVIAADVSYKELVEELNEQFEIVKKNLDRIKDRFKYRMLINVSYPLDRANKIEDDIYNELKKINKEVDKLWGKIG